MNKKRLQKILRRVVIIAVVFVLVFSLSSVVFSAVFFHFMFARRDSVKDEIVIGYSLIDSDRYSRRAVSFLSGGNTLRGYLYGEKNKNGLIIIAPGIKSDADGPVMPPGGSRVHYNLFYRTRYLRVVRSFIGQRVRA